MPVFGRKSPSDEIRALFSDWDSLIAGELDSESIMSILGQATSKIKTGSKAAARAAIINENIKKVATAFMVPASGIDEEVLDLLAARQDLAERISAAFSGRKEFADSVALLQDLAQGLFQQQSSLKKRVQFKKTSAHVADAAKTARKIELSGKSLDEIFRERMDGKGDFDQKYFGAFDDMLLALEDHEVLDAYQKESFERLCNMNQIPVEGLSSIIQPHSPEGLVDIVKAIELSLVPRIGLLLRANDRLAVDHPFISQGVHDLLEPFREERVKQITGAIEARISELEKLRPVQKLFTIWLSLNKDRLALIDAFESLADYVALRDRVVAQLMEVDSVYVMKVCPKLVVVKLFERISKLSEGVLNPSEQFVIGEIDGKLKALEGFAEDSFSTLAEDQLSQLLAQLQECNQLLTVKCENPELSKQVGGLKQRLASLKVSWFGSSALKKVLKDKVIFYVQTVAAKGQDIAGADAKRATLFVGEFTEFSSSYSAIEVAQAWCAALLKTPGGSVDPTILDLPKSLMELPTDATGFYSEKKSEVLQEVALLYEAEEATVALPQAGGAALFRPVSPQTEEGVVSGGFRPRSSPVDSATRGQMRRPSSTTSVSPPPSYIQAVHEKQGVLEGPVKVVTPATASLV